MNSGEFEGVVIDIGSVMIKAGFSGDDAPRAVFPNEVRVPRNPGIMVGMDAKDCFVGDEYGTLGRDPCKPVSPIPIDGSNINWNRLEKIFHHTFYNELRVTPEEHRLLLTALHHMDFRAYEILSTVMFEQFQTPFFSICCPSVLSLLATGKTSGLVLSCGGGLTEAVSVYECLPLENSRIRLDNELERSRTKEGKLRRIAGEVVTDTLVDIIMKNNSDEYINTRSGREIARDIKEKRCCLSLDPKIINKIQRLGNIKNFYKKEEFVQNFGNLQGPEYSRPDRYELPDGTYIHLKHSEVLIAPEILFKPSLAGYKTLPGVHELVKMSCDRSSPEMRDMLCSNITVSGGTTMIDNFPERLSMELESLMHRKVDVNAMDERKFSTWIGGSIWSSLSTFADEYVTREEWDEHGSRIVKAKCVYSSGVVDQVGIFENFFSCKDEEQGDMKERVEYVKKEALLGVNEEGPGRSFCVKICEVSISLRFRSLLLD